MAKNFIAKAIKRPGALHRKLGVPQGEKIPPAKIEKATHSSNPTLAREANFAQTLSHLRRADGGKIVKVHYCDGGKMRYADGGKVPTPPPPPKPTPEMTGSGLAAKAGKALQGRKSQLDKAIEDAGG